ncbi:MAG: hypothetical protein AAF633_19050 [Chloroflexota bacterium]
MYSWSEDTSSWYGSKAYSYSPASSGKRRDDAKRAKASGPRTYEKKNGPIEKVIDPTKMVRSTSKNPLIVAVDVTGSMAHWPFEIFDRLPLLYNTLSQYRDDLEICFAAIGDGAFDRWPLQVTNFAGGYDLEQLLGGIYGEGGGGDAPESYGLFAHWVNTHVEIPNADEMPFCVVFGDINMHPRTPAKQIRHFIGDQIRRDVDSIAAWQQLSRTWNTWFLRRPTGRSGDHVDEQWGDAIGAQKIFHIADEQRAVDTAMGIIARAWGHFDNFQENMLARQNKSMVDKITEPIAMLCPRCGAPLNPISIDRGVLTCGYCSTTLRI